MTPATDKPRPLLVALLLGAAAEILFLFRLGWPHKQMFDEVYYVPAAKILWSLDRPFNIEHPLVGKELIGLGIRLFGDTSFGWRFPSTIAASAVVMGVFAIAWLIFERMRVAVVASILTIVDMTVFIQARIAMLDGFMAAFLVLGVAAILWSMRGPQWVRARLALAGVLLGLACGAKWTAVPLLGFAGLSILVVRWHDGRAAGRDWEAALYARGQTHWPGVATLPALLILGVCALATYFATFAPALFYTHDAVPWRDLLSYQLRMYREQTEVLPAHPYQSSWWSWPLDIRPIWYLYERVDGAQRGVLMIGNPAVIWGGLLAVVACLYGWWRDGSWRLLGIAGLWLGSFAIFIIIPKSLGFFYYYYPASIFLSLAIAAACNHFVWLRDRRIDEYATIAAIALFGYFYPIISSQALAGPQSFQHWMWLPTWP
jgi:dolichyl-phosphate-mannose-protein mannosyltransferase